MRDELSDLAPVVSRARRQGCRQAANDYDASGPLSGAPAWPGGPFSPPHANPKLQPCPTSQKFKLL